MTCIMCSAEIVQPRTGRPRRFCSDACRLHHHRSKPVPGRGNEIAYTKPAEVIQQYRDAVLSLQRPGGRNGTDLEERNGRPLALDLFCGGGGAAMGLYMAGFDVIGVDIHPRPEYPFRFVQGDATKPPFDLDRFDLIWASPPCQKYSSCNYFLRRDYPDLVDPVRVLLRGAGVPYIIENVPGAPLVDPVALTGPMFGLKVNRRRHFECSFPVRVPLRPPARGKVRYGDFVCVAGSGGGEKGSMQEWREGMDIDWLKRETLTQAVPPAYSWWLARQLQR